MTDNGAASLAYALICGGLAILVFCGSHVDARGDTAKPIATAVGPVAHETYAWKHVAIGGGGFITGYDSDPSGTTRIIRTDVYGAYLWLSDQKRWAQLVNSSSMPEPDRVQDGMNEGVFEIVVAPSDANRIYMAIKGHVYRSDNRGVSFSRVSRSSPFPLAFDPNSEFRNYGPFMAVSPTNPDVVFFGTPAKGLWRSDDAGETWQRVVSVPPGADLRPEAGIQSPGSVIWFERTSGGDHRGRIWVISQGHGVFVSSDEGRNFAPLSAADQPQPTTLKQGVFAPNGAFYGVDIERRRAWMFRDGVWTDLTGRSGLAAAEFAAVAVNPRTSQIFVFDEGGDVSRSSDGGESWSHLTHRSRVGDGDPPWLRVSNQSYFATGRVQFDPVIPNRMWVGAGTGVYFADVPEDATQITWTSESRGIEELVANDVVQPKGRPPMFAAWDFGVRAKDDLDAFSTTYGPKERVLIAVQQLAWSPSDPDFVVTNASDTRMTCCSQDGDSVLAGYSLNSGRTWSKFVSLPQPPGTKSDDPWRMSFGTIAVSSGDTSNIVWEPSFNRSPFYTKDRGLTWERVVFPGEQLPDTGSHSRYTFARKTLAADSVDAGVFYLVHSGEGANAKLTGLWKTRDGGATWQRVFKGEIAPDSRYSAKLRAVPGETGHLFFTSGVAEGSDTWLRRSTDGGVTWHIVSDVDHVDDVGFGKSAAGSSYPTIFISGRVAGVYGIWRSTDNALTWRRVAGFPVGTLDQVSVLEGDKDVFGRVYLGYKGSGWIYGQPTACNATGYRFPDDMECVAVQ